MNKMIVMVASMALLNVMAECPKEEAPCKCDPCKCAPCECPKEAAPCKCDPCKCAPCECPKEAAPCKCDPCKCAPCECPKKAAPCPEAMVAEYEACIRKGVEQGRCTEDKAKEMIENYRALSPEWQKLKLENARRSVAAEEKACAAIQQVESKVDQSIDAGKKREAEKSAHAPQL